MRACAQARARRAGRAQLETNHEMVAMATMVSATAISEDNVMMAARSAT